MEDRNGQVCHRVTFCTDLLQRQNIDSISMVKTKRNKTKNQFWSLAEMHREFERCLYNFEFLMCPLTSWNNLFQAHIEAITEQLLTMVDIHLSTTQ